MYGRVTAQSSKRAVGVRVECVDYTVPGWGTGEIWMRGGVLLAHELSYELGAAGAHPPKGAHGPPTGTLAGASPRMGNGFVPMSSKPGASGDPRAPAADLVGRFCAFLGGEPVVFDDVELDLEWATPFQRALTTALRAIPRGEVVTYGELAALATNRFALVVPCHRVVAASGIGGYGPDGVPIKRRLLALEGVSL